MKKIGVLCSISGVIIISMSLICFWPNTNKKAKIVYAITENGIIRNSFPEKGLYNVHVDCSNADAQWDYYNWKLYLEKINGNISCDISFNTITKEYLNQKIMNLSNTMQGDGKVVNEVIPVYDGSESIELNNYLNQNQFITKYSDGISRESIDGFFEFNTITKKWETDVSKALRGKNYNFEFTLYEDGYYQMCYEKKKGNSPSSDRLFINDILARDDFYTYQQDKKECIDFGFLSKKDKIRIQQYVQDTPFSFELKKATNIVQMNDYRYEGKNPNNYILFNNELWRIIGMFSDNTHGIAGKKLIKIMREKPIGAYAWNTSNSNDWSTSSLKQLLNDSYYNRQDGTSKTYCKGNSSIDTNCDYRNIGIDDLYRKMIQKAKWHLGQISYYDSTTIVENHYNKSVADYYKFERGNKVFEGNKEIDEGYIGLIYPSDYGYSVLANKCSRGFSLYNYLNTDCAGESWMIGEGAEWTITSRYDKNNNAFRISRSGGISTSAGGYTGDQYISNAFKVRPTLYLNENVYTYAGDGSIDNPYIIGMDEISE